MLESVQTMAPSEPQVDLFAQKRMELMVDMATKKVQAEMQQLRQQVQKLEGELSEVRKRVNSASSAASFTPQPQHTFQERSIQQQAPSRPIDFSEGKKVSADVPRYGKYTSDDVSVEKFFNYGTGRKK